MRAVGRLEGYRVSKECQEAGLLSKGGNSNLFWLCIHSPYQVQDPDWTCKKVFYISMQIYMYIYIKYRDYRRDKSLDSFRKERGCISQTCPRPFQNTLHASRK